jgi:hypothetical protein
MKRTNWWPIVAELLLMSKQIIQTPQIYHRGSRQITLLVSSALAEHKKRGYRRLRNPLNSLGAGGRDRTVDLLITNQDRDERQSEARAEKGK